MKMHVRWAIVAVLCGLPLAGQDVSELSSEVERAFESGERFSIPSLIADPAGDAETIARYLDVERALYWENRNLAAAVFVAEQGIAYCLTRAELVASESPPMAQRLRAAAGRIAYNLASSTWPGWMEPGIEITPDQRQIGWGAARLTLSLSERLDADPAALANANWMVGAHQLAAGQFRESSRSFERAALLARGVGDRGMELTSSGFAAMAEIAGGRDTDDARERFEAIERTIAQEVEDPEFWTGQLETAARVFIASLPE